MDESPVYSQPQKIASAEDAIQTPKPEIMALRTIDLEIRRLLASADELAVKAGVVLDVVREWLRCPWNSGVTESYSVTGKRIYGCPLFRASPQSNEDRAALNSVVRVIV